MKLARTIRFDPSDLNIFPFSADEGEWALSGTFTFHHLAPEDITGKVRQAFANGFLGISSFGYSTFVSVVSASAGDLAEIRATLITRFMEDFGAPSPEAAGAAADEEIAFMADLCRDHQKGTLLTVMREFQEDGIHEQFRHLAKAESCAEQKIWTMIEDEDTTSGEEQQ